MYKPETNLVSMGETVDGKELFVYIDYITPSNVAQSIKHRFMRLLKIDDENFEIFPGLNGPYMEFFLSNGIEFRDKDGNLLPELDVNNSVVTHSVKTGVDANGNDVFEDQPKPLTDGYDRNFAKYGPALVGDASKTIKRYLGFNLV